MCRVDSDNSRDSGGDFRRSASARLPRNKNRGGGDALNSTFNEESGDSARSGEQVGVSHLSFSGHLVLFVHIMNYTFLHRFSSIGIHFCINCEIPEGGVNEASSGVEAADASVTVDSEVVAKRVSHPDSD